MIETGCLQGTYHKDGTTSYEWRGGPIVELDRLTLQYVARDTDLTDWPRRVRVGPYVLRVVDPTYRYLSFRFLAVRDGGLLALWYPHWYRLWRLLRLVKARLIETAVVWNLADYHPNRVRAWRDLRWPKHD